jgi:hypothetical protein
MFYNDRNPPHFHVVCSEFKVVININDEIVQGFMPKRALKFVFEWMDLYKVELLENWELAQKGEALNNVKPLN